MPFVFLDCEVSDGASPQAYDAIVAAITAQLGPVVGDYGNASFLSWMAFGGFAQSRPLWFADRSNADPSRPRAITQAAQGAIVGVVGNVDIDTADEAGFALVWGPSSVQTAPVAAPTPVASAPAPVAAAPAPDPAPAPAAPWYKEVISKMPEVSESTAGNPDAVKRAQGLLNAAGSSLVQDGIFGPKTLREVLAF